MNSGWKYFQRGSISDRPEKNFASLREASTVNDATNKANEFPAKVQRTPKPKRCFKNLTHSIKFYLTK